MDTSIRFVPFQPEDYQGVECLFSEIFGFTRNKNSWNWQFEDHPKGKSWILLAKKDEAIVGHFAFRRNHINFIGSQIIAGQACDAMIASNWQGKGLFSRLFLEGNEYIRRENMKVAFGFPNRCSYPADMRKLARHRITYLQYYSQRIGYKRFTGPILDGITKHLLNVYGKVRLFLEKKLIPYSYSVTTTTILPDGLEEMLREWRTYEVLSLWKDCDYMRWRYQKHPDFSYKFHYLSAGDRVEAFAVTRDCGQSIAVCEFIHRTKDLRQSIVLLRSIVDYFSLSPAQKIEFKGWDNGFFDFVFSKSGFKKSPSGIVFTAECFGDEKLAQMLPLPCNWTLVHGDMDVI